jgi:exopolysaccharide biosynthesis protein
MSCRLLKTVLLAMVMLACGVPLHGAENVSHAFTGITYIVRTETSPRPLTMHIVKVDLRAAGVHFAVTPSGGSLETVRSTTLDFLKHEHAQVAINAHFFSPFPSSKPDARLIGFAVSDGRVYSAFEHPEQSFAIVDDAPALNIDPSNHATIVHDDARFSDGMHVRETVKLWNTVAGSAQIVTDGVSTVPVYKDAQHPNGLLKVGGPKKFSNTNSWNEKLQARTAIGVSRDECTLVLFTVDKTGGSLGMKESEIADLLIRDYGVYNAINLDGGGSTSMAMEDPARHTDALVNKSSDNAKGRSVGSNLAVFAQP